MNVDASLARNTSAPWYSLGRAGRPSMLRPLSFSKSSGVISLKLTAPRQRAFTRTSGAPAAEKYDAHARVSPRSAVLTVGYAADLKRPGGYLEWLGAVMPEVEEICITDPCPCFIMTGATACKEYCAPERPTAISFSHCACGNSGYASHPVSPSFGSGGAITALLTRMSMRPASSDLKGPRQFLSPTAPAGIPDMLPTPSLPLSEAAGQSRRC